MTYEVISFTLGHKPQPLSAYRHDAPFIDGDKRAIRYVDDDFTIDQQFCGSPATGGWYD